MQWFLRWILIGFLLIKNLYLRWRCRRMGIDPDQVPEIQQLRADWKSGRFQPRHRICRDDADDHLEVS